MEYRRVKMKHRLGFVSNSSTCSFLIYGVEASISEVQKILLANGTTQEELDSEGLVEWFGDEKNGTQGLYCEDIYEWDAAFVGRHYSSMGDDETMAEFKKDVAEKVEKLFGKEMKCEEHEGTYPC